LTLSPNLAGGRLTVDLDALVANWRALDRRSKPGRAAAVVKANAYGLGIDAVSGALAGAGCQSFFVATADEAVSLKRLAPDADVYVMNGIHAGSVAAIAAGDIIPCLSSLDQIDMWADHCRQHGTRRVAALAVDTGMNRLGLTADEARKFALTNRLEHIVPIIHVMSHFACADRPDHPLNREQLVRFQSVMAEFENIDSSLSNSAAVISAGAYGASMTRPGIAIYGGEALEGAANPMKPVVTLEGRIIQIRDGKPGETVSYGAAHSITRNVRIAIVSTGYADGYPRSGSGAGVPLRNAEPVSLYGMIGGHRVPQIGRVTMDLTMFDVTDVPAHVLEDGWIELIGPNVPLDEVARACGTIGYEVLTGLGKRFARHYRGGAC